MGEKLAAEVLEREGYTVIARNVHSLYGELDLIAVDSEYICFVEVKVRKRDSQVSPVEAVGPQKRRRIITTALLYLQNHPSDLQPRFDIFSIVTENRRVTGYDHLKGAFDTDGY
jgi:putative endonuclease